jgi:hypothetical protein
VTLKGGRGPATGWDGFDEALAGGPVRSLTTKRVRVTGRGVDVVEHHVARFPPDRANLIMIDRLRRVTLGELTPTDWDLRFYTHELREFVRYRRLGWREGVPRDKGVRHDLWRQAHCATLDDYDLPLQHDDLLYHPDALRFLQDD